MPSVTQSHRLSFDECERYCEESVFLYRPPDYQKEYPKWPGQVGIEVEMFVLDRSTLGNAKPTFLPLEGSGSLGNELVQLAERKDWQVHRFPDSTLISGINLEHKDRLTFEPGGQLEYSSVPYPCLSDALERLHTVQAVLRKHWLNRGIHTLQTGINPWLSVEEIGLQMHKPRYQAMDAHFTEIGAMGRRMMRQTATVQVNLDFGDNDSVLAKRFLAANLLSPLMTAIFANSPQVDGKMTELATTRAQAWRYIDQGRTGIPELGDIASELNKKTCVAAYLQSVMAADVVFITGLDYERPRPKLKFRDWLEHGYKGCFPTIQDFETHLSLHFPEVRARGFLELRSVDCQSRVWQSVPSAAYCALLYVDKVLDHVLDWLVPQIGNIPGWLKQASRGPVGDLSPMAAKLMNLAVEGFSCLPPCFQGHGTTTALEAFAEHFTLRGQCPADDLRRIASRGDGTLNGRDFEKIEERWYGLIQ